MAGGPPPAAPAAIMHDCCRDLQREGASRTGGSSCEHGEGVKDGGSIRVREGLLLCMIKKEGEQGRPEPIVAIWATASWVVKCEAGRGT